MIERYLQVFTITFAGVALLTLLIFWAATPIVCGGLRSQIDVPWASSGYFLAESERDLSIFVTNKQQIFVGPTLVEAEKLSAVLCDLADRTARDRPIFVSADRTVPYCLVEHVLAATRDAGFRDVSLVTFSGTRLRAWVLADAG